MAKIYGLTDKSVKTLKLVTSQALKQRRTHGLNHTPAGGAGGGGKLLAVVPVEQPQADGTISVKKLEPTLSAMTSAVAFDIHLFGNKQAVTDMDYLGNSYGLSSFVILSGSTTIADVTLMQCQQVSYPPGDDFYVSVQPVFSNGGECPV